jgi:hypothetical protein
MLAQLLCEHHADACAAAAAVGRARALLMLAMWAGAIAP